MFILGIILVVLGLALPSSILLIIGIILLVLGLFGNGAGYLGRPVGGRRFWY